VVEIMRGAIQCPRCGHWNPPDSNFCEMCGTLLQRPIPQPTRRCSLNSGSYTIPIDLNEGTSREFGRADLLSLLKPEDARFISRRHFAIKLEKNKFYIKDLGSKNGTKVNGNDIRGKDWIELSSGDRISVADVLELTFTT
jgi:pSer/pThr/pTyr-binding forkhead associated (FHA) protein